jgi:glycosyltransferase involved in cell wall biosynthesis
MIDFMKNDLVSVIIPCYNQSKFLAEAIQSVLDQTYPNVEIIAIDDGSTDNIEEVIQAFPQIAFIKQKNQGAAIARNKGIEASRGSYLVFLDADDRLLPNALELGVHYLHKNPSCAFVTGGVKLIDSFGNFLKIPKQAKIEKDHFKTLLATNYIWTPGVVTYRKSIFDLTKGFDPEAGGSADYELNIRIARQCEIASHGEIILEYRVHGSNMSKNLAYMLKSGVSVRRAQRRYISHDSILLNACKEGIRCIQKDVGKKLVLQTVNRLCNGEFNGGDAKHVWYLIRYYPNGFFILLKCSLKQLFSKGKQVQKQNI